MKVCKYECLLRHNSYNNANFTKNDTSHYACGRSLSIDAHLNFKIYQPFEFFLFWSRDALNMAVT